MQFLYYFLLSFTLFFLTIQVMAAPPVINHNVPIMQNIRPSQCPSSWRGRIGPEEVTTYSRFGERNNLGGPGVRSCSGCTFNANAQACVCRTCYDYFMSF